MKNQRLRRDFLRKSLMASGGLLLISPMNGFASNSNAPELDAKSNFKKDIRKNIFGRQFTIIGQVFDRTGQIPIRGARIKFWHKSPNSSITGHVGELVTDEQGRFHILSDYPSREYGKSTTVHFQVSNNLDIYRTDLKFSNTDAYISDKHWERNKALSNEKLFPKMTSKSQSPVVEFNLSI